MRRTLAALVLALAALATACGDDDGGGGAESVSVSTTGNAAAGASTAAGSDAAATTTPAATAAAAAGTAVAPDLADVTLRVAAYPANGWDVGFETAGLDDFPYEVEWANFPSGADMITAINGGSIDVASSSEIPPIFAAAASAEFRSIAVIESTTLLQELIVPGTSPAQTVADLRGKKVAYVRATTAHYFLLKMLEEAGLTFADIEPVPLSPADGLAALQGGSVDALASYGVSIITAKGNGARTLASAQDILSGNFNVVASTSAVSDPAKKAATADFLGRLQALADWQAANVEEWARVTAETTQQPYEQALETARNGIAQRPTRYVAFSPEAQASQQDVADVFQAEGLLPDRVEVTSFWDTSFAASLAAPAS